MVASPAAPEAAERTSSRPVPDLVVPPGGWVKVSPSEEGALVEAALGGGLLETVPGGIKAPQSGDHWLATLTRDQAGNVSPLQWVQLRVDGEAPQLQLTWTPEPVAGDDGRDFLPPGSRVQAEAQDALAGVRKTHLQGGDEAASGPEAQQIVLPSSGEVAVSAWAEDRVGNRTEDHRAVVIIDNEAPTGEVHLSGPSVVTSAGLVAGPGAKIVATVEDHESGLQGWAHWFDGAEVQPSKWQGPWDHGPHKAEARALDRVGNSGVVGPLSFHSDIEGPKIQWRISSSGVLGDNGEMYYRPPVSLEISAEDSPAGVAAVEWAQGDSGWTRILGHHTTVETSSATLALRSEDQVTNRREETASWNLDTEAPRLVLRLEGGKEPPPRSVVRLPEGSHLMALAVDSGVGVASQEARLEPGMWSLAPQEFHLKTRGTYRLELRAEDRLGNRAKEYWWLRIGSSRK